ncbi:MAG: HpcH/HpaI aldolase family protein [Gammaproteobacteria bacterium]
MQIENVARKRLEAGNLALGIGLRQARTVDIAKIMMTCGYDWLFIDMEHSAIDVDTASQISVAAQDAGIAPLVRVPGFEHHHASRVLDGGAQGVVVPHVDSVETAKQMVANSKYAPVGNRSIYGLLPQVDFQSHPLPELTAAMNEATLVVLMIETPEAVGLAHDIAGLDGVDALLVGTNDLSLEMGIPGQLDHPDMAAAIDTVVAACRAHGKHPGLGGVYQPALMQRYVEAGMRLLLCGSDLSMMMAGARQQCAAVRALNKKGVGGE